MKRHWWLGPVIIYFCMLATMLLFVLLPAELARDFRVTIATQWIVYAVPLGIVYLHVRRYERKKKFWSSVGVRREKLGKSFIWLLALLVIFTGILTLYWEAAEWAVGADPQEEVSEYLEGTWPDWYFAYMFGAAFIPVAFSEELIFRGFVLDRFLVKGPVFAIVASSAMFSSLHLWYTGFGLVGTTLFGGVFLLAVHWGIVYYKTRNIAGLVFYHGLYNAMASVNHFWGAQPVAAITTAVFAAGMLCLGYFILRYIRRLFREIETLVRKVGRPSPLAR